MSLIFCQKRPHFLDEEPPHGEGGMATMLLPWLFRGGKEPREWSRGVCDTEIPVKFLALAFSGLTKPTRALSLAGDFRLSLNAVWKQKRC